MPGGWGVRGPVYHARLVSITTGLRLGRCGGPLPRLLLHALCARWQFLRSNGLPPWDTGMISSTSPRLGCGVQPVQSVLRHFGPCEPFRYVKVLSTGSPQSQQMLSSRLTRLTTLLRAAPLARLMLLLIILPVLCIIRNS